MELFYGSADGSVVTLGSEESAHCVRVMRHRVGDSLNVFDGSGTMYGCVITDDDPRCVQARVTETHDGWGSHPYHLTMAVCPTKNPDRYEWFAEKATEVGVDIIAPVIGDRSERRVFKAERLGRILLSAAKQSLKGAVPTLAPVVSVREFIRSSDPSELNLIAYCFEDEAHPRTSIREALGAAVPGCRVTVLIGPEGDFSPEEASLAISRGFVPVHLGPSRLRTETAALTAVEAVYLGML